MEYTAFQGYCPRFIPCNSLIDPLHQVVDQCHLLGHLVTLPVELFRILLHPPDALVGTVDTIPGHAVVLYALRIQVKVQPCSFCQWTFVGAVHLNRITVGIKCILLGKSEIQ